MMPCMTKDFIKYRKRRRKDGYWEIAWSDPKTGNARRESCKTRDEHSADHKLAEKILTGDTVPPEAVTIGYLLDRYYQYIKRNKRENTIVPMKSKVERLMDYMGTLKWSDFSQEDVENYIGHARTLTRWDRGKKTLSDGTIKKDLTILRTTLKHAHGYNIVPQEKRIEIRNLASSPRTDWLDKTMMNKVIALCEENPDREHIYAFLIIALATGARKEAVFELKWNQVYIPTPETKLVEIEPIQQERDGVTSTPNRAFQRVAVGSKTLNWETGEVAPGASIDFGEGHGNKPRPKISIAQNPRLMSYFLYGGDRSQPYVVSYRGERIKTGIKKGLEAVGKEANLPFKLSHHVLKRTCVTWMVRGGVSFEDIEKMTNTTVETLKKHYNHHNPNMEKALGDIFSI